MNFQKSDFFRVSVQGVKSLGGHFAYLCRGFEFYGVKKEKKKCYYFSKRKWKYFYTFNQGDNRKHECDGIESGLSF